ncbi:MAG TPA: hypothetical protein VFG52_04770 [Xanthomonadales bacterium]|nr:hypothetical protein [Xanthomonadales bacterium]
MEIALLKLVHILAFVCWLGADLAVWYLGFFAANRKFTSATRVTVTRVLFGLDMVPRISMTLTFGFGIHLAYRIGYWPVPPWVIYASYLTCLAWMGMVLYQHYGKNRRMQDLLRRFDFGFRLALISVFSTYAAVSLSGPNGVSADFIAWKLLLFASMIACDLMVRIKLKPFGPAFAKLLADKASQEDEDAMEHSLSAIRLWKLVIWLGLVFSAAFGVHLIG